MLGKLIKTEFKASGRLYLPLFIGVIFFAVVERILLEIMEVEQVNSIAFNILFIAITAIFVIVIVSVCVSGQFISIYRFYKSVFTDEGYLTNTLPVKSRSIIISKLLVGVFYTVFSYIVLFISGLIIVAGDLLKSALDNLRIDLGIENTQIGLLDFILDSVINLKLTFSLLAVLIVGSLFFNILVFFVSFAIGNMANRKKVLLSVIIYIGIVNVLSFISAGIALFVSKLSIKNYSMLGVDLLNITLSIILAVMVVIGLASYFATNKIIKSRLNLE